MDDAEQIAAGLSEAQSQTLLRAKANNKCDGYHLPQHRDGGRMKLTYRNVDGPPLHPNCRCDVIAVTRATQ